MHPHGMAGGHPFERLPSARAHRVVDAERVEQRVARLEQATAVLEDLAGVAQ